MDTVVSTYKSMNIHKLTRGCKTLWGELERIIIENRSGINNVQVQVSGEGVIDL